MLKFNKEKKWIEVFLMVFNEVKVFLLRSNSESSVKLEKKKKSLHKIHDENEMMEIGTISKKS